MKVRTSLREALSDERLLGKALAGDSWHAWRTILLATMGEKLTAEELVTFRAVTGRNKAPTKRCEELIGIIGQTRRQVPSGRRARHLSQHPDRLPRRAGHRRAWLAALHCARL